MYKYLTNKIKFKNRICFNMFLNNAAPLLPHRDAVAAECYQYLKIVWSENVDEIKNFWQKNIWLKDFITTDLEFQKNIFYKKNLAADIFRKFWENILDLTHLNLLMENISYKLQKKYLEKKFISAGGAANGAADYLVTPSLAAYHFPVSNYSRAAEKYLSKFKHVEKE